MKVFVDTTRCVASGRCYEVAPRIFTMSDEGKSKLLIDIIDLSDSENRKKAEDAEMMCPAGAITLEY